MRNNGHSCNYFSVVKIVIVAVSMFLLHSCASVEGGNSDGMGSQPSEIMKRTVELVSRRLYKIKANPSRGFNYDYYLSIPQLISKDLPHRLLVSTTTGKGSDEIEYQDNQTRTAITKSWEGEIASELNLPLLIPVFPRKRDNYYTHALNREAMQLKNSPMSRLDLQLISIIEDAQEYLASEGIHLSKKVFLFGFSSSGAFSNRFAVIHPDVVQAVASGGISSMPIIPAEEVKNRKLTYPVGIADLFSITGIRFNMDAYKAVPQYIYMGDLDTNDATLFRDSYTPFGAGLVHSVFGSDMKTRWKNAIETYKSLGISAKMVTYEGVGHEVNDKIISDIANFFRTNN